jgi:hypothetical protein
MTLLLSAPFAPNLAVKLADLVVFTKTIVYLSDSFDVKKDMEIYRFREKFWLGVLKSFTNLSLFLMTTSSLLKFGKCLNEAAKISHEKALKLTNPPNGL